ncbi:MAG: 2-dehydro-3-deoxyphosphogluconate aldolase, partial [Oscillospiraceae bacterium]|nr:2-dehydro-3-deoxyphosphogluconate aldolase [Oscillospiraceae bacterium]
LVGALGDRMLFGAGTVTSVGMVRQAHEAGARFIVSPNTDEAVIRATRELDMASIPGALTPTEILCAHSAGADFVKVFPACNMGVSYFKNIRAPLKGVRLLAVGGVALETAADYMSAGCAGLGVAGCLFRKEWVRDGEWARVTQAAQELLAALRA